MSIHEQLAEAKRKRFREHLEEAIAAYAKLPAWKRAWLEHDWLSPTVPTPREPVNNNKYCEHCGRGDD